MTEKEFSDNYKVMDRCYRVKLFQNIGNNSIYD